MNERMRLIVFIAAMMLLFAGVSLIVRGATAFDDIRDHASVRTNPWGAMAWRELLEASEVATATWRLPLTGLSDEVEFLVLFDPVEGIESTECAALAQWVSAGGRLVVAPFAYRGSGASDGSAAQASVERVLSTFGISLSTDGDPRSLARPRVQDPLTADLMEVLVPTAGRLQVIGGAEATVLLSDEAGRPVAVTVRHGEGQAIVLSEAEIFSNAILSEADNVVFAANVIFAGGPPEMVHFDEFHHGLAETGGVFNGPEVDVAAFQNTALALLAVAMIYALGRSRRFGAATAGGSGSRRSSAEYVQALAQIHSRSGAAATAASMLAGGLRRKAATAARMPSNAPATALAGGLNARGMPGDAVAELLGRLEYADKNMTDAQLLTAARQVAQYERML